MPGVDRDAGRAIIEIRDISFAYRDDLEHYVLRNLNLKVYEGECLAVLGESGSGKSTLLKVMCGLLKPTEGEVLLGGKRLRNPSSDIAMIFQNYGLFPWKSVRDNIILPALLRGERPENASVDNLLDYLGLSAHGVKYPRELSGGQRQRCALGRAVMSRASLILMDEPFSALDIRNRERLQRFMNDFLQDMNMTAVMVTHSIEEALLMGDRIAVFDPGRGNIMDILVNPDKGTGELNPGQYDIAARVRMLLSQEGV